MIRAYLKNRFRRENSEFAIEMDFRDKLRLVSFVVR
jgi:hypothetical protein